VMLPLHGVLDVDVMACFLAVGMLVACAHVL
jgi:hypothetical protein